MIYFFSVRSTTHIVSKSYTETRHFFPMSHHHRRPPPQSRPFRLYDIFTTFVYKVYFIKMFVNAPTCTRLIQIFTSSNPHLTHKKHASRQHQQNQSLCLTGFSFGWIVCSNVCNRYKTVSVDRQNWSVYKLKKTM